MQGQTKRRVREPNTQDFDPTCPFVIYVEAVLQDLFMEREDLEDWFTLEADA